MKRLALAGIIILAIVGGVFYINIRQPDVEPHETVTQSDSSPVYQTSGPTRAQLLELTNKARTDNGLPAIPEDPRLDTSAQAKADDEVKYGYENHVNPVTGEHGYELAHEAVPTCGRTSENLAIHSLGYSAEHTVNGFMNSPPHRAAILSPYDISVGFGINGNEIVEHFCMSQ